jgi:hypothetical protein
MREQRWRPDTHPGAEFIVRFYEGSRPPRCTLAIVDGVEQADPQAVYETVVAENRLKNEAYGLLVEMAPDELRAPVTDEDGDPRGIAAGDVEVVMVAGNWHRTDGQALGPGVAVRPLYALKSKHEPQWRFGAIDGRLEVFVPFLPAGAFADVAAALLTAFGDRVRLVEA